jgi:hypothetical protein
MADLFIVSLGGIYFERFDVVKEHGNMQCAVFSWEKENATPITAEEVEILTTHYPAYKNKYIITPYQNQ